ncbi:MAG: putative glycolipid-binding domain-containing protein, partial [Anaerolineales bacterium]
MNPAKTKLEVLWRQVVEAGSEHLVLSMDDGIHADSLSVGEIDSMTYRIHYQLDCDAGWNVQRLRIEDLLLDHAVTLVRGNDNG